LWCLGSSAVSHNWLVFRREGFSSPTTREPQNTVDGWDTTRGWQECSRNGVLANLRWAGFPWVYDSRSRSKVGVVHGEASSRGIHVD
jgi:hypothetical protein